MSKPYSTADHISWGFIAGVVTAAAILVGILWVADSPSACPVDEVRADVRYTIVADSHTEQRCISVEDYRSLDQQGRIVKDAP